MHESKEFVPRQICVEVYPLYLPYVRKRRDGLLAESYSYNHYKLINHPIGWTHFSQTIIKSMTHLIPSHLLDMYEYFLTPSTRRMRRSR